MIDLEKSYWKSLGLAELREDLGFFVSLSSVATLNKNFYSILYK